MFASSGFVAFAVGLALQSPAEMRGAFIENLGQWDSRVAFACPGGELSVFAIAGGFRIAAVDGTGRGAAVFVDFGADPAAPEGLEVLPGTRNFLRGSDPNAWVRSAKAFGAVAYEEVAPGVDLLLRMRNGSPSFDFELAAGADAARIPRLRIEGIESLVVEPDGGATLRTAIGPLRIGRPLSWATGPDGVDRPLSSRFERTGERSLRVVVDPPRDDERVIVDPDLVFSTLLGGVNTAVTEVAHDVAYDDAGAPIVVGATSSLGFPVTPGAYDATLNGVDDVFVSKFTVDGGDLVFSTLVGGSSYDAAEAVAVAAGGAIVVAGDTRSPNFPVTASAFDTALSLGGPPDGFVLRLAADGSSLVWSTYFGGTSNELPRDLALDAAGNVYVAGHTNSSNFPVTPGAYDPLNSSSDDGFVTKFSAAGNGLYYSTYLGASGVLDNVRGLALAPNGEAIVTGRGSVGFPVTQLAYDPTQNGGLDAFVARLNANGSGLVAGTFLGGSSEDAATAVAVGLDGAVTICGEAGLNFPVTPGSFDSTPPVNFKDAFVARLDGSLSALLYSTYLGGEQHDEPTDLVVDDGGGAIVTGVFLNGTTQFPTTPDALATGLGYAFLSRLAPDGSRLTYSTYLSNIDALPYGLASRSDGTVFVTGITPPGFPTTPGAFDTTPGFHDVFLAKFDLCPGEIEVAGAGCAGSAGYLPALAVAGCASPGFTLEVSLTRTFAPTDALLLFGLGATPVPLTPGCALGIGPLLPQIVIPLPIPGSGAGTGSIEFSAVIPPLPQAIEFKIQAAVADPGAAFGVAASNPIRIRVDA